MYFPAAEIDVSPFLPFAGAFCLSFFCSMSGISGAFLLLPFQVSVLGYAGPGASATNQIFNILACPSGVWRYAREGRLCPHLALAIAAGSAPGAFAGAWLRVNFLARPREFLIFAGLVLIYMAWRLLAPKKQALPQALSDSRIEKSGWSLKAVFFSFGGAQYLVPLRSLCALSFATGLLGGVYGIGGGAVMAPFLIAFFGLPARAIAGATLASTFLASLAGVGSYAFFAHLAGTPAASPDWLLGLILGAGGIPGMYLGAALQKHVPEKILRAFMALLSLAIGLRYLLAI